jgi:DNA replication protein DnaC
MLKETTVSKLHEMRLTSMAESYRNQLQGSSFNALSFEERFSLMVDIEWARRKNNKLTKLIRKANFQLNDACTENIEYHPDRKLDKAQIMSITA